MSTAGATGAPASELPTTIEWLAGSPHLLVGIAAWLAGFLLLERRWYRRTATPWDPSEAALSARSFVVVGATQVAISLALIPVLELLWPHRLQTLSMRSPLHWAGAWVVVDLIYYWIHRFLHATRLGWSLHAPHHSIPQVSMLDSLRISWGEQPVGVLAYGVPLVLLGVPPYVAGMFYLFVSLFQFALHTEMSWSLGPLDAVVYTPAAHRSHHASERPETDRNYGGFFLLFDRLFGTYTPTDPGYRPEHYGLPGVDRPRDLREAIFGELERLAGGLRRQPGALAGLRFALARPGSGDATPGPRATSGAPDPLGAPASPRP